MYQNLEKELHTAAALCREQGYNLVFAIHGTKFSVEDRFVVGITQGAIAVHDAAGEYQPARFTYGKEIFRAISSRLQTSRAV